MIQRIYLVVALAFLMASCGSTQVVSTNEEAAKKASQQEPTVTVVDIDRSNNNGTNGNSENTTFTKTPEKIVSAYFAKEADVKKTITYLASDELQGREAGSPGIEKAAQYIEGIFKSNGIVPYFSSYRDDLSNFNGAFNMVGMLPGTDAKLKNEYILIGAHYDHIGKGKSVNGDTVANGANDNAAGTTAVLELVRYFSQVKNNKRSIIFALFSAEEKGLLGSVHLAKRLKQQNINLYTMVNFEMIGVPMKGKDYLAYITGYKKSNMADAMNAYAGKKLIGYLPTAAGYNLFQRSDNYPFYNQFKVPSHTVCTFDFTNFDYYHHVDDEVSQMDIPHMTKVVNEMIPVLATMFNTPTKEIK
ncbi:M28 family metallopeptidase [Spongiivirga citrea]|uniref:M20/M25/M40 family metallo-hydrolase n=1 Tax=Spongiivirga citrea TaxID=1481457 RepID=A0A6M0CN17_9FLAO|nr:M20/M25/M40 family metallo-hydrolase [Spongiivirga citrea]NER18333.1 M20/M25/M40 family metallo-hydrolase [Spongiivirga citrea]